MRRKGTPGRARLTALAIFLLLHALIPPAAAEPEEPEQPPAVEETEAVEEPPEETPPEPEPTVEPEPEPEVPEETPEPEPEGEALGLTEYTASLGNWTTYNGMIFGDTAIYDSTSGGGLAVAGTITVSDDDFTVGSTYAAEYDPTRHIGVYENEGGYPALLLGGDEIRIGPGVDSLQVHGGPIVMTPELHEVNGALEPGFTAGTDDGYQWAEGETLEGWFSHQRAVARRASSLFMRANRVSIPLEDLSSGAYLELGPEYFQNEYFEIDGRVYDRALFITVRTDSDLNLGQWWPVYSLLTVDVDWAIDYDLVVFNFPDAVNVTMNSSAFAVQNLSHWSTTVDAWVGERGMTERKAMAEKVVYNFPAARSVEATHALIQGTVMAPDAVFTGVGAGDQGHIYGHIIAGGFVARGNFTIHAFNLSHWVYDIAEDSLPEETPTGSVRLRQYLYFQGQPTTIPLSGGQVVLRDGNGAYFDGEGGFISGKEHAAVYAGDGVITGVPPGEYTLEALLAPEGFVLNDTDPEAGPTYVELAVEVAPGEEVQVLRHLEPLLTNLTFVTRDGETGEPLPGNRLVIVREADEYSDVVLGETYLSGAEGEFVSRNVPVGRYRLVQLEAPEGHDPLEEGAFSFTVWWDGEAEALAVETEDGSRYAGTGENPVVIPAPRGRGENTALVVKYAVGGDGALYPLPGAELDLYRLEDGGWVRVDSLTTGELGYALLRGLDAGTYRLVETVAPPGYLTGNPHRDPENTDVFPHGYADEFTVGETPAIHTAYLQNTPVTADVTVLALGDWPDGQVPLSGVSFRLERLLQDGSTWDELIYAAATDTGGEITLSGLEAGQYRLTQRATAPGYIPLDPEAVHFTLAFAGDTPALTGHHNGIPLAGDTAPVSLAGTTLTVGHGAKTRGLTLYKVDSRYATGQSGEENPYLEGAEFRLQRSGSIRTGWQDYGGPFTSGPLYDEAGDPLTDSAGRHIAGAVFSPGLIYGDYRLVETVTPEGYITGSDVEVTLDDGTTGHVVRTFTVTEAMTGTGGTTTYTVADYHEDITTEFRFYAVDSGDGTTGLTGAGFALYFCPLDHEHDPLVTGDSCWASSTPVLETSGPTGLVRFTGVKSGDYMLLQTRAPAGYHRPTGQWRISVNAPADTVTVEAVQGAYAPDFYTDGDRLLLPQQMFVLPSVGGSGTLAPRLGGLAAVLLGALALWRRRRQSRARPGKQ